MSPEHIERMRPLWAAADWAIREHVEYTIDIAKAFHTMRAASAGQAYRRAKERY